MESAILSNNNLDHFSNLRSLNNAIQDSLNNYSDIIWDLQQQLEERFQDFKLFDKMFTLFNSPFPIDLEDIETELQCKVAELQCDEHLKADLHLI